jgi:hypothetical protein
MPLALGAQTVQLLASGHKTSLRGLSVVNDQVVWASGSNGTVAKSLDGGQNWQWMQVKGFDSTDFRDIEAFDATTAIIMGIAEPAYLLKTVDGGATWKVVYENKTKGMFLDAMEFWNEQSGIVLGDPIGGRFFIARTFDGGTSWQDIPVQNRPQADSGEACFASSGTNIRKLTKSEACFVSGGRRSRLFIRNEALALPIAQGTESTGANSLAVKDKKTMMVVGGDFNNRDSAARNSFISFNGGKSWGATGPLHGYRSCVEHINGKKWISCGLNGVDFSTDNGNSWQWIAKEGYHVCRRAKNGKTVFFAGGGGRIGKLILP